MLGEASTGNYEPVGFFFGSIASDGTYSGVFTDIVGLQLTALPAQKYNVTQDIDKDGVLPALDYLHLYFDFSSLSLVAYKQLDYTGTGGFNAIFSKTDFMTLRTITAYPNYSGAIQILL